MAKYYIHKDGRIYLVKKNDKFYLPSKEEIPFEIKIKTKINCAGEVYFCNPEIDHFPQDWMHADEIVTKDDIDNEVKESFIYALTRPTVGGIILNEKNEVLMVRANRGLTKDYWNGPGGFLEFGEDPKEGIVREVLEETGYKVSVKKLHNVYSMIWKDTCPGYHMISIFYILNVEDKVRDLDKSEIDEIKFMPIEEAIENTKNDFVKWALRDLLKEI